MTLDLPRRAPFLSLPHAPSLPLSSAKISSPPDTNPPKKNPHLLFCRPQKSGTCSAQYVQIMVLHFSKVAYMN
uniref:Uncharacterized protein n=1 Tax=Oryza rufipogon TaxID=4529 RepID=A0A0E0N8C1_ORYRU